MKPFPIIPIWVMTIICLVLSIISLKQKKKNWLTLGIIILLFFINLRIMIPTPSTKSLTNNLDVLFVIDTTISMNAEDYNGKNTRLSGVKKDCKYIINKLDGAKFSIITFHNYSKIITPFTQDTNITIETIDMLTPIEELYAKGSSLNTPIKNIISSLQSSQKKNDRLQIIFFFSDGEITDNSSLSSYQEVAKYVTNGAILGYGSKKGGHMKVTDKYTNTKEYILDNSSYPNKLAVSKLDENNLKKIAKDINLNYIHMENQNKINKKLKEIESLIQTKIETTDLNSYEDTYYLLALPLLILLIIQLHQIRGGKL